MIIPNNWRLPYDPRMTVGLLLGGLPVEEYLDAGHLIDLPVTPFAHAAEVGVPLQVNGKVDGDVAEQAVVEFQLEVEVGLKGALGQPVLAFKVCPCLAVGEAIILRRSNFRFRIVFFNLVPCHVLGFLIVVEEFHTGVEVEVGKHILSQVLSLDITTESEVNMFEGGRIVAFEIIALQHTIVSTSGNQRVIVYKGGLTSQERE